MKIHKFTNLPLRQSTYLNKPIYRSDCMICGASNTLLIFPKAQYNWAYCTACKNATSLEHFFHKRKKLKIRENLWQQYRCLNSVLSMQNIPDYLLSSIGMPMSDMDLIKQIIFNPNFIALDSFSNLHRVLFKCKIRYKTNRVKIRRRKPCLCLPIVEIPGFMSGYVVINSQGVYLTHFCNKANCLGDYVFLRCTGNKEIVMFDTVTQAISEGSKIILSGDPSDIAIQISAQMCINHSNDPKSPYQERSL